MARSRISIAKPDIVRLLEASSQKVFKQKELATILRTNREDWRIPGSTSFAEFLKYLIANTKLRRVQFKLPHRAETRYIWGNVSQFKLAVSMKPTGYLSHYSAVYLHELTEQLPKTVYVNHEQRPHTPSKDGLTQERIEAAFRRSQRITNNVAEYDGIKYCYVNGMHTGRLGVVEMHDEYGDTVPVTGIERTLIDITTRPMYAGGVIEVIGAYERAHDRNLSVNKLSAMLKKLGFVYPYEQAIGFYLERAGFNANQLRHFEKQRPEFDFYLVYGMKETAYSKRWRLFFPKRL